MHAPPIEPSVAVITIISTEKELTKYTLAPHTAPNAIIEIMITRSNVGSPVPGSVKEG
jgi:hypothetical protein